MACSLFSAIVGLLIGILTTALQTLLHARTIDLKRILASGNGKPLRELEGKQVLGKTASINVNEHHNWKRCKQELSIGLDSCEW